MTAFAALSKASKEEYLDVLRTGYLQRLDIDLLDTDGEVLVQMDVRTPGADAEPTAGTAVVSAELQMDLNSDVTRTCTLGVIDDAGKLAYGIRPLDQADLDEDPYRLYPGKMVRATYCVYLPAAGEWAEVPVFTGPIMGFSRQGANVTLEAVGKEAFLIEPFVKWRTTNRKPGANVVGYMRDILASHGEKDFRGFTQTFHRLQKDYSVTRWESSWPNLRRLAQLAGDRLIYYAGDGYCVLRQKAKPTDVTWTFKQGLDVIGEPTYDWDFTTLRNTVATEWQKGEKRQPPEIAQVAKAGALSPFRLRRNGKDLVMASLLSSQTVTTKQAAFNLAKNYLLRQLGPPVTVSFECLPIPHLEEYQRVAIEHDRGSVAFTLFSFSLGLMPGGTMSINVLSDQIRKLEEVK